MIDVRFKNLCVIFVLSFAFSFMTKNVVYAFVDILHGTKKGLTKSTGLKEQINSLYLLVAEADLLLQKSVDIS